DVLETDDADAWIDWLRHRNLIHRDGDWLMVHAGLLPAWSPERAAELAGKTEQILHSDRYAAFLDDMYGNRPRSWSEDLDGIERHRVIINATTRMRCIDAAGRLDFDYKQKLAGIPDELMPWFAHPERRSADIDIVFGHWSAIGYHHEDRIYALDSGCVWGDKLTALRLEDEAIFQVDSELPAVFD
ncbi:MAG: symmetrical bis(5'-nucleosyl)-tetraphosphatase, partial [Bradymonadaceae bacterium]